LTVQFVPFVHGMLYVGSVVPLPEEDIGLVKELAVAFSIAYARYLDFQQLEEKNRQVEQASQYKSQFLSRMSHDLRTPMNAILGYTRILLRKAKDALDERQYRNLENIQLSADHLLSLINDILDLSRIEAGRIDLKPEPVDLKQLVVQCTASVESLLKPGVELKQEIAEVPPLYTDPDRLRRVLMNLLSNAVKFTERGRITVSLKSAEGWVGLSVADTGVGIPAEDLPYIFEEFRQSGRRGEGEKQGSGLGLAIAKGSVELLGGSIAVESQIGKGTRFTLKIADYRG
jgi:signal transduction histidine kinase